MKTTILKVLKYTEIYYDDLVFDTFMEWCGYQSYENTHFQLMLSNNKLYNWYMREYAKCEKQFLYVAKPYINNVPVKDLRALYDEKTAQIKYYPKAILNEVLLGAKFNAKQSIHKFPLRTEHTLN